ncbi:unnamed protein product [Prunus brigantina]
MEVQTAELTDPLRWLKKDPGRLYVSGPEYLKVSKASNHNNLRSFILHRSQTPLKCENCAYLVRFGGFWCRRWTVDQVDWPRRLSSLSEALYRTHEDAAFPSFGNSNREEDMKQQLALSWPRDRVEKLLLFLGNMRQNPTERVQEQPPFLLETSRGKK